MRKRVNIARRYYHACVALAEAWASSHETGGLVGRVGTYSYHMRRRYGAERGSLAMMKISSAACKQFV